MDLRFLTTFWLLTAVRATPPDCVPRRYVSHREADAKLFREDGVVNYSTMLLREDLDLLVLGARDTLLALDLDNISTKRASVKWEVTDAEWRMCQDKGKNPQACKNHIKVLHKMADDVMYVCGTRAYDPQCDNMTFSDGTLTLAKNPVSGDKSCPYNPAQGFASLMDGNTLYTAANTKFRATEPLLCRNFPSFLRTESTKSFQDTNPNFVSMAQIPAAENSSFGMVYLFFSEKPVECDCLSMAVSRVARICKEDPGGAKVLQKKFTSFMKARMDCPVPNSELPYIIQDTYLWCEPQGDCLFYGIFTQQSKTSHTSAVCLYRVSDINEVFGREHYKTKVSCTPHADKWTKSASTVPRRWPGTCAKTTISDATVVFLKEHYLMDAAIQPVGGRPLLVRRGTTFTHIVANQIEAADGATYSVMFIGTVDGTILKAVNYDGEMFIIEEIQLFPHREPIRSLKISSVTRQLYAASDSGVAQIPLASCERSPSCMDCVLARDPYCGWDNVGGRCVAISESPRGLIQSVQEGNASLCPRADPGFPNVSEPLSTGPGGNLILRCPPPSNLAKTKWEHDNGPVVLSERVQQLKDKLLILDALESDGGLYRCLAVERSKSRREHATTVAEYQISVARCAVCVAEVCETCDNICDKCDTRVMPCLGVVVPVVTLLVVILAWNFYKGHLCSACKCAKKPQNEVPERS